MNSELPADIFTRPRGGWVEKIQIKHLLSDEDLHLLSDEDLALSQLREKGKQKAAILSRARRLENDEMITNFDEWLLDDIAPEDFRKILDYCGFTDEEEIAQIIQKREVPKRK